MKEQDIVMSLSKSKGDLRTELQQFKPPELVSNIDHQNWLLAIFPLSSFSLIVQIHWRQNKLESYLAYIFWST